jgi:hypothetical protein
LSPWNKSNHASITAINSSNQFDCRRCSTINVEDHLNKSEIFADNQLSFASFMAATGTTVYRAKNSYSLSITRLSYNISIIIIVKVVSWKCCTLNWGGSFIPGNVVVIDSSLCHFFLILGGILRLVLALKKK